MESLGTDEIIYITTFSVAVFATYFVVFDKYNRAVFSWLFRKYFIGWFYVIEPKPRPAYEDYKEDEEEDDQENPVYKCPYCGGNSETKIKCSNCGGNI